ncbi:MAG TPA: tetratricopeptide repeat protein [Vicinamibacterales bacterium]|jgi:tetratricopeptide (TPR) repeat protein|nr:tetratricopeptide repeat protein [Vicinamibacterales bacterium]
MKTAPLAMAFVAAAGIGLYAVKSDPVATSSDSSTPVTPQMMSIDSFNSGLKHLNNGDKAAAGLKPSDQKKSLDEYGKALKDFQKSVKLDPNNFKALNGLGYAYRKTGDYEKALQNYDEALKLSPNFPDAIEYRGEAYLNLNRLDDAKKAYLTLYAGSRTHADLLLKAMKTWADKRHADPAGVDPTALAAFEGWLHERAALAERTVDMARNSAPWR